MKSVESTLDDIISDFKSGDIIYSNHFAVKLVELGLKREHIRSILEDLEVIEEYEDDFPCPSLLCLGYIDNSPIHIVLAKCGNDSRVVTIYEPIKEKWDDFRRRK